MSISDFSQQQSMIFQEILNDRRLELSAKRQIQIFLDILRQDCKLGFDTTSALLFGFLNNEEFTDPKNCSLTNKQVKELTEITKREASCVSAHDIKLLKRVKNLPLSNLFQNRIDLKDLAVSFLTYAAETPYPFFSEERNKHLHEYLDIPDKFYLNVFNATRSLKLVDATLDDLIINMSRINPTLWVPQDRFITVEFTKSIDRIGEGLEEYLGKVRGEELENITMELFDRAGYIVVKVGRRTNEGDGGVDIIAVSKMPLANDIKIAIQCKASRNRISTEILRSFNSGIQDFKANKGVLVTTSKFSAGCQNATEQLGYQIELMDYIKLTNRIRDAVRKS